MRFLRIISLLVILFSILNQNNNAQLKGNFETFSIEHGLSHNFVNIVFQDSRGFLWIGTKNGLNRYDGYSFDIFRQQPNDSTSISDNYIRCITEDNEGDIWVGTNGGLNHLDIRTEKFTRYYFKTEPPINNINSIIYYILIDKNHHFWLKTIESVIEFNDSTNSYNIYKHFYNPFNYGIETNGAYLYKDDKNTLWIGSKDGLNAFNLNTKKFSHFSQRYNNPNSISNNHVNTINQDTESRIWIGTNKGLNLFIDSTQNFIRYIFPNEKNNEIISSYHENNMLWFGTNDGIVKFNTTDYSFESYNTIINNKASLELNVVTSIIKDNSNVFWLGTNRGLIKYNFRKEKFKTYNDKLNVTAIYETEDSTLWLGTKTNGLKQINCKNNDKTTYISGQGQKGNKFPSNYITAIFKDIDDNIWIGTTNGIVVFNQNNRWNHIETLYPDIPLVFLDNNSINTFYEDTDKNIWVGTNKGLLIIYNAENKIQTISNIMVDSSEFKLSNIHCIEGSSDNTLVIGGEGYLFLLSSSENKFVSRNIPLSNIKSELDYMSVNDIERINDDIYWIATSVGLKKIYISKGLINTYGENEGLPSNNIKGIISDDNSLWISTSDGIAKFNTSTSEVESYSVNDGLQNYEFNQQATFKNKYGKLYFGGITGYNSFYPDSIALNNSVPRVSITKIQLISSSGTKLLDRDEKNRIVVPHENNSINIYYSSLDFNWPLKNRYKYKLAPEGVETDWIDVGNQHYISFANIKPGTYSFHVIGSNNDGIWDPNGAKLTIVVPLPFSRTSIAYFFYTLFIIIILYLLYNYRTWQLRKANEEYKERERVNYQIAKQKEELSIKNKNITDSINYAKRIQMAMLPSVKIFNKILPQSFIFYRPKDIVSGDFYWISENSEKIFVAAVDCTGHGVPGAFMSIIGIELLRKIINTHKLHDPSKVLNVLNQDFADIFKDVDNITLRDGMDIAFCAIDKKNLLLEFSGAFNPLYVIRDNTVTEIKGDRFSVGIDENEDDEQVFKNHVVQLQKDDIIYIFTDGYADQFGGPEGKKYKYRRFRHLLLTIHSLPLEIQKELLSKSIEEWKGELDQVDDILVIGIKPQFDTSS